MNRNPLLTPRKAKVSQRLVLDYIRRAIYMLQNVERSAELWGMDSHEWLNATDMLKEAQKSVADAERHTSSITKRLICMEQIDE